MGAEAPRCCSVESLCVVPPMQGSLEILLSSPAVLTFTRKQICMPGYTSAVGKAKPSPCSLFETRPNIFVTTGDFIILHHLQTARVSSGS